MGQYLGAGLVYLVVFWATDTQAGCPQGQETFTSCQIEGRNTEVLVCYNDQVATYSYGPIGGAPDLFLSQTIARVDFEPWSGLGKAINESITFYNGDYSYEVVGGFDRPFSEEEMLLENLNFGWLEVAQNGETLSRLSCNAETVDFSVFSGIYDAKIAAGLNWDESSRIWLFNPNHPTASPAQAPILMQDKRSVHLEDCLPAAEFELSGVRMGVPVDGLGKLIPPVVGEVINGDVLEIERFMYDGLRMDTLRGTIIEMEATTPFWEMPSGLKVGLTRGEVIRILGRVPNGDAATSKRFGALVCMGKQDTYAEWYGVIEFGHDKRVQSINFSSLSP